jgi:MFS family permease
LKTRGFAALFAGSFFDQTAHGVIVLFTPLYLGTLGAGPALTGVVIGLPAFAYPLIILVGSAVTEHVAPRRLIIATRGVVAVGLLGAAVARSWWQLAPALTLVAVGALGYPAVSRVIADTARPDDRARALALVYGVGGNLSMIVAPTLGGTVAGLLSLRWVYLAALVIELLSLASFAGLSSSGIVRPRGEAVTYRAVLACRPVLALSVFLLLANLIWMIGFALLPTFLHEIHHLGVGTIGRLGSVTACGGMLLVLLGTRSRRHSQPLDAIIMALVCTPLALGLLAGGEGVWLLAVASFLSGGLWILWPLVDGALGSLAPAHLRQRSFAFSEVFGGAGAALGPIAAGLLYDVGPRLPLQVALAGTLLVLLPAAVAMRVLLLSGHREALHDGV